VRLGRALPVLTLACAIACGPGAWPGSIQAALLYRASTHTLRIERAPERGAAARAGLRAGDVVTAIDGDPVASMDEQAIRARLRGETGTRVTLHIERDGAEYDVTIERAPAR
jgi:C-terminal processing protease CtpA/Prc